MEHAKARIQAGVTLRRIANDLGINQGTLDGWLKPRKPAALPAKGLRSVVVVDDSTSGPIEMSGPVVEMPSGVRILGLDAEGIARLLRALG
jgi:hypothetical protein